MSIKQGANDANIIVWALTSTIGRVVNSIIALRITRSIVILVLITLITVPFIGVAIVITLIRVIVVIIRIICGSVPVKAPASLMLGILSTTSLMLGILVSTFLMGLVLILYSYCLFSFLGPYLVR